LRVWQRTVPGFAGITLNVNVSGVQLTQPGFAIHAQRVITESGICPADVTLEVTESVLMEKLSGALPNLLSLRDAGVQISIDDFGTGYSSLSALQDLPIGEIKVDRSFLRRMSGGGNGEEVVRAIVAMGAALGKRVIAENRDRSAARHAGPTRLRQGPGVLARASDAPRRLRADDERAPGSPLRRRLSARRPQSIGKGTGDLCLSIADWKDCRRGTLTRFRRKGRRRRSLRRRRPTAHRLKRDRRACARRHRRARRYREHLNGWRAFRPTCSPRPLCVTTPESQTSSRQPGVTRRPCEATWIACLPTTGVIARVFRPTSSVSCLRCARITTPLIPQTRQYGLISPSAGNARDGEPRIRLTWRAFQKQRASR